MSVAEAPPTTHPVPRLKARYQSEIKAQLQQDLDIKNVMQVPNLEKIVINMGVGRAAAQPSLIEAAVADLTGSPARSRSSPRPRPRSQFKLREGQAIGVKVTLRGDRMWEFLDRLISVAIPRIRVFRGLPANSWDGRGNYTFGLSEQTMFAEIDPDKADHARGMDITIVTTATTTTPARPCSTRTASPSRRAPTPTTSRRRRSAGAQDGGKRKK